MVFDYMEHDMAGLLERANAMNRERGRPHDPPFSVGQVKRYMKQLFHGLALLQANRILHRDLKNANLLVSNMGELKVPSAAALCAVLLHTSTLGPACSPPSHRARVPLLPQIADFGLARHYFPHRGAPASAADTGLQRLDELGGSNRAQQQDPLMTNRVITLWYRPPELCLGADHYGLEVDMWSAGCIMVEMLTGRAFFPGRDEASQVDLICQVLGRPTESNMPGCTSLKE